MGCLDDPVRPERRVTVAPRDVRDPSVSQELQVHRVPRAQTESLVCRVCRDFLAASVSGENRVLRDPRVYKG